MNVRNPAAEGYRSVRQASASLHWLTRIGFVAKGIVYILIGVLALMAAFGEGGETTDQKGVIQRVAAQPFGELMLIVIGAGLLAYALWRFVSSISDTEGRGNSGQGIAQRAGQFLSGLVYASLAIAALRVVSGSGSAGGDATQTWTARLMQAPGGTVLVILAGIAMVVAGVFQMRHGWTERFTESLERGQMNSGERPWIVRAGKWGYMARGVVFAITGTLVMLAGLRSDPSEAHGLEGSLDALAAQPFGQWLLALVAAGLVCFGAYSVAEARYRRIRS